MKDPRNSDRSVTRRNFLHAVGSTAGTPLMYRMMGALGLLASCGPVEDDVQDLPQALGGGRRVVILGAGIAGLTAAYELRKLGFRPKVLEATRRTGGRSLTVRAGDVIQEEDSRQVCGFGRGDHLYMNLGPARIPYHHDRLLGYCKEFGVALEVFTNDNRAGLFHSRRTGKSIVGRQLHADVRGHVAELLVKAVKRGALDEELTAADKDALRTMLTDFGALDAEGRYNGSERAGYADRINAGLDDPSSLPLHAVTPLREILGDAVFSDYRLTFPQTLQQQPTMFQPVGGMDRIVEAFSERVGDLVEYESIVTRIESTESGKTKGVEITYRDARGQEHVERADFAICTIPAPVLKAIPSNFRPELAREIAAMTYVRAVKVGLQTKRRFWEEDHRIFGGITWTDQENTQVWYPASGYQRAKGILVAAYTWDEAADTYYETLSPADRLAHAGRHLDNVHPGASSLVESGISRAWGKVPFQKGSWLMDDFGYQAHAELAKGDAQVYFAGEHVSFLNGWQEGAILSSRAAVRAISLRVLGR